MYTKTTLSSRHTIITFSVFIACLLMISCSSKPVKVIKAGPGIAGLNLTGGYDCKDFGFMRLRHVGSNVRGTYEGVRGNNDQGTIRGKVEGDILWVDWIQPGNLDHAIAPIKGKGWLRILKRGEELSGEFGYDDSIDDGGKWTAFKSEFSEE